MAKQTQNIVVDLTNLDNVELTRDAQDLIITNAAGEQEVYKDFFVDTATGLPKQLTLADGTVISMEEINTLIEIGEVAPAAGGAAAGGGTGGGAGFAANQLEGIGDGLGIDGLLEGTNLNLGGPAVLPEAFVAPAVVAEATPEGQESVCVEKFNEAVDGFLTSWKAPIIPVDAIDDSDIEVDQPTLMVGDVFEGASDGVSFHTSINRDFSDNPSALGAFEQAAMTNDLLDRSGATADVRLIGDILLQSEGEMPVYQNAPMGMYGPPPMYMSGVNFGVNVNNYTSNSSNVTAHQFDDILQGGAGDDLLVGDFAAIVDGSAQINGSLSVRNEFYSASDSLLTSFNDSLVGGAGDDTLVGDALFLIDGEAPIADTISINNNFNNTSGSTVSQFNDVLEGGDGDDLVVGDVFQTSTGSDGERGGSAAINQGIYVNNMGQFGFENSFTVGSDSLTGDDGQDTLVGDVAAFKSGDGSLNSYMSVRNSDGYGGNDNENEFTAFSDVLDGGDGNDVVVGDVLMEMSEADNSRHNNQANHTMSVSNDLMYGSDGNKFSAFNDLQSGGSGDDTLVGDNYYKGAEGNGFSSSINLSNQLMGSSDNEFSAFNDIIDGGTGTDVIVGDILLESSAGSVKNGAGTGRGISINVENSAYSYGGNTDNNTFAAFNDSLYAGATDDAAVSGENTDEQQSLVVGDFYVNDPSDAHISVRLNGGFGGGEGNTTDVFNDGIVGSQADDVLVGDLVVDGGGDVSFYLGGERGGELTAFSDHICGGDGNDLIVGDFHVLDGDLKYKLPFGQINGEHDGGKNVMDNGGSDEQREYSANLFQDTLMGERGDDTLIGGFGKDTLSGGEGNDSFLYHNVSEDGHDTITDFEGGDVTDLDALFDELGIASKETRAEMVSIEQVGDDSVLTIEGEKGDFENFSITFEGTSLTEANAAGLEAQGIIVGGGDIMLPDVS